MKENYCVQIEEFAERHFLKSFEKKYKSHWTPSFDAIVTELQYIDKLLDTDKAESIVNNDNIKIVKTQFRVIGTKESAKSSGNRCIVAIHEDLKLVKVLLVYSKTDLSSSNETATWKRLVKENYPGYSNLFLVI